ncbi:hypothetical protein MIND_00528100 [Mycena indigotica]|uniref:G-protein coupled receptors family 2 profile 2 domain-containing protein n=1 Tax=Mycena indigotica TaxID=2126181 RepID=A0A8H6SXP3_9AGAR|nr:uncharacterized protein MIND_00528100 [Mycena indigotica]KAF7307341.1 hypothetical protein MIND_00528100 [Mycena indigotica]
MHSRQIWGIGSAIGACLCFLVLSLIALLYARPRSRPYLNRVSFRVMVYALTANMLHGIATAVCAFQTQDSSACGFSVWLILLTLQFSSWLIFGIALNLQLVLIHGISGHVMEKYYILSALIIALCVTIPPFAYKQYGWDDLNEACWMTASDPSVRLKWQLTTQLMWSLLAAVGESVVFCTVLSYMFRHQILHGKKLRNGSFGGESGGMNFSLDAKTKALNHAALYRSVIIRISCYPLASIIINGLTVACDLYLSVKGSIDSEKDLNIAILNNLVYGLRPSIYALLAVSDPALLRALRSAIHDCRSKTGHSKPCTSSDTPGNIASQLTVHIELEEVRRTDDGEMLPPLVAQKNALDGYGKDLNEDLTSNQMIERIRKSHVQRAKDAKIAAAIAKEERQDFKSQI